MTSTDLAPKQELIQVVEGELCLGNELRLALSRIREDSQDFVVHDSATCAEARQIVKRGADEIKRIIAAAEPHRLELRRALDEWVAMRDRLTAQFASVTDPLDRAAREYNIAEVNAAKAEQDKINKGQRAANRVEVKPDIQTVSGTRFVVKYRLDKVLDASKVKREYMKPDVQKIEKQAREDKDPAVTEKKVGGVKIVRV